jgi:L-rhamnose mutarotase
MEKLAFKMKLKPGCKDEYLKIHHALWPEVKALLKDNGISDYSIFFDEATNSLFAVQKVNDRALLKNIGSNPIIHKWWDNLAGIMDVNADNSPVITNLEMIFHLD